MCVRWRYGIAVSPTFVRALLIGNDDFGIRLRMFIPQPAKQGGSEIETDVRVVVHDYFPARTRMSDPHAGIWLVTLGMNALVPVVQRRVARLRRPDSASWSRQRERATQDFFAGRLGKDFPGS